jgi:hypothetical protein
LHQTLADPLEGVTYGRGKAKVFRQHDQELLINSFAHGGIKYQLLGDADEEEEQEVDGQHVAQSDILIKLAAGAALFHDGEDVGYADLQLNGHRETYRIRSARFQNWLGYEYFRATKSAPNANAMTTALSVIEAKARYDGPERKVQLRIAGHEQRFFIDLGDKEWRVVEIDQTGWRLVSDAPVRFIRKKGMRALPLPVPGGAIKTLQKYCNIKDPGDFVLSVSWVLAALRPLGLIRCSM